MRCILFGILLTLVSLVTTSAAPITINPNLDVRISVQGDPSHQLTYASHLALRSSVVAPVTVTPASERPHLQRRQSGDWYANRIKEWAKWSLIGKTFKHYVLGWQVIPNDPSQQQPSSTDSETDSDDHEGHTRNSGGKGEGESEMVAAASTGQR